MARFSKALVRRYCALQSLSGILFCLLLLPLPATALDRDQLTAELSEHIRKAILDHYSGATAEKINIDLTLPNAVSLLEECSAPLHVTASRNQWIGNVRLRVACEAEQNWTTHVVASVGMRLPVVVLSRSLPRNSVLTETDITLQELNIADQHQGFYLDADAVIGSALARDLGLGYVLHSRVLNAPKLVSRGDAVTIRATGGGISVSMAGTALTDGVEGRQISVRNNNSGKVVRAWVIGRGLVEVPFTPRGE
ncbi:flagellar basal body P-ring formation chaperone FlgA [Salinispirillum sp. LH 10-3-1]|uniref:Flagella basal body P-ring formation protein FlgA n=1 Tax=Salinispirillum sp. LH 10-3-1 TaxID=2952525 RepID=A0AB38YCF1_9GAMM